MGVRKAMIKTAPVSSPTQKFHEEEYAMAEKYLAAGITPAAAAHAKHPPTINITVLELSPNPVIVNQVFEFHVKFKLDVPSPSFRMIPGTFYYDNSLAHSSYYLRYNWLSIININYATSRSRFFKA